MTDDYNGGGQLEWNSNIAVLQRVSNIISAINDARFRTTRFDEFGNVMAEAEEVLSHLICLYKEISVELTDKEKEVWVKLSTLRDKLRINPPKPKAERMAYWKKTIDEIDDLDLELRTLAKRRGFLASNKKDVNKAALWR
jgi:hypothetical protein